MAPYALMAFPSSGVRCAARLYRPSGTSPQPCVVMAHGFSGTIDNLVAYAERFVAAGLAVFAFDYRGFGESEGEPRQLMNTAQQRQDWVAAIATARQTEGIDPDRIALWGSSFSGGHVIAVAASDPRLAAIVAQVPLIDAYRGGPSVKTPLPLLAKFLAAAIRDTLQGLLKRPPYLVPVFGAPDEVAQFRDPALQPFFDALARESPTWRNAFAPRILLDAPRYKTGTAERVAMPLLVCVAEHDVNASPDFAVRIAELAPRGEVKRYPVGHFDVYPEMPHNIFDQVVNDQIAFLRAHLVPATLIPGTAAACAPAGEAVARQE